MNRYLRHGLETLTLLLLLTIFVAGQSQSDDSSDETGKTGAISGRIVNESGQGLANVLVTLRAFGSSGEGRTTTTDAEGSFRLSGLKPVLYVITTYLPAYITAPRDPDSAPLGYLRVGDTVRLELVKGGVITGTVTTPTGGPVVVVPVSAQMIRDGNGQPSRYGFPARTVTTDDRGVYRIYGLLPGTYIVSAGGVEYGSSSSAFRDEAPTFAPSSTRDTAAEVTIHSGEEAANVDVRYRGEPGHRVSGVVPSAPADQSSMVVVVLNPITNGVSQTGSITYQSPGDRGFSFSGVADGDYYLTARVSPGADGLLISEPRRIKVRGADIAGIELSVKPLGSIFGHVTLEDSAASDCQGKRRPVFTETIVTPWHNEKTEVREQPQFVWSLSGPKLLDKQGQFVMLNLWGGQYRFNIRSVARYWYLKSMLIPLAEATTKGNTPARPTDAMRNWINLKSGERLSGLTIILAAGAASIRGSVDLGEGQKLPVRLFIYLVPAERESAEDVVRFFGVMVLPDRSFEVSNLPPGRYWVLARAAGENDLNVLAKLRLPDETDLRAKLRQEAEAGKLQTEFKPCQNVTDFHLPFR
ncbi:MAG: hypothetical protein QOK48_3755 [Blastocatellia bacterium]|jgi:hypothetical protein|nr:hypothetical protein [Blastocatellia bacterium]